MESNGLQGSREAAVTADADEAQSPRSIVEELRGRLDSVNERVKGFIKERPAACLLGAAALGYILARIARRRS